jgi:adenylate cyclase
MPQEIERKFLVQQVAWDALEKPLPIAIQQGYIFADESKSVRIRRKGDKAFLTIKQSVSEIVREEFEYAIPVEDATYMLEKMANAVISKGRYEIAYEGHLWEVDVFEGDNEGLIVAEIELKHDREAFEKPSWLGEEVSNDPRYLNVHLAERPFKTWAK